MLWVLPCSRGLAGWHPESLCPVLGGDRLGLGAPLIHREAAGTALSPQQAIVGCGWEVRASQAPPEPSVCSADPGAVWLGGGLRACGRCVGQEGAAGSLCGRRAPAAFSAAPCRLWEALPSGVRAVPRRGLVVPQMRGSRWLAGFLHGSRSEDLRLGTILGLSATGESPGVCRRLGSLRLMANTEDHLLGCRCSCPSRCPCPGVRVGF